MDVDMVFFAILVGLLLLIWWRLSIWRNGQDREEPQTAILPAVANDRPYILSDLDKAKLLDWCKEHHISSYTDYARGEELASEEEHG